VLRLAVAVALTLAVPLQGETVTIRSAVDSLSRGRIVFYSRRQFAPAWSARDRDDLLAAIRDAKSDGLDPADYHLASIERTSSPRNPSFIQRRADAQFSEGRPKMRNAIKSLARILLVATAVTRTIFVPS